MLQVDLILQIMNQIDHYLKGKNKNVIELMKHNFGGKIMITFARLRAKTYSYLIEKKTKHKFIKRKR